jgi:ADP-ribosyl-[dinitrogen reductase] hydrolase
MRKERTKMMYSKNGIIGLVIGDAMGVPLEFCKREDLIKNPTTTMKGYGSHDVPKGS